MCTWAHGVQDKDSDLPVNKIWFYSLARIQEIQVGCIVLKITVAEGSKQFTCALISKDTGRVNLNIVTE